MNKAAIRPANKPDITVAFSGVLNLGLTSAKNLKISPSLAIAYRILGSGYRPPNKEVVNPAIAPTLFKYGMWMV